MTKKLEIELYKLTDSFLTEAKDQNGNERSLKQLNQDRHLFVENCLILIQAEREQAVKEYTKTKIFKKEIYIRGLDAEAILYIESAIN